MSSHVKTVSNYVEAADVLGNFVEVRDNVSFFYKGSQRVGRVERIGLKANSYVLTIALTTGETKAFDTSKMSQFYRY